MITIFKPNGKKLKTIPHNLSSSLDPMDDFFNHISAGELLDDHLEYDEQTSNWGFTVFSDKIKICLGNTEKTMWIPRDPDTNIGWFKKGWYLCYCEHHGYSYTYEA